MAKLSTIPEPLAAVMERQKATAPTKINTVGSIGVSPVPGMEAVARRRHSAIARILSSYLRPTPLLIAFRRLVP